MGMYCKNLEELDCGSCFQVTDIGLKALLEGKCMQLSYVRIKGCLKVRAYMVLSDFSFNNERIKCCIVSMLSIIK